MIATARAAGARIVGVPALVVALAACGGGSAGPDAPPGVDATCLADPSPPGGACPAVCTGGCADGVCTVACGPAGCNDRTITCPPDFACTITCTGVDACDTSRIECPTAYPCAVRCDQYDACGDVTLACGAATCAIDCLGGGGEACGGARVECGAGPCRATCAGTDLPAVTCGSACSCAPCG